MIQIFPFRFQPGENIKTKIKQIKDELKISAGVIISAVGSLNLVTLRLADNKIKKFSGPYEIISLTGTISSNGTHLHISLSDNTGQMIGGHFKEGIVHTTCELMVAKLENYIFAKEADPATGFKELAIYRNQVKLV